MKHNRNQLSYLIFYLLFSPDTWRILIGLVAALVIGPRISAGGSYSQTGQVVIWLMILALGYVLSAPVGRFISNRLTTAIKGQVQEARGQRSDVRKKTRSKARK